MVFERLVSVRLGLFMERSGVLPTTLFAYWKGLGTCYSLYACPIHCKVHWRVGRRPGSCRLISAQPLIGSTIWKFSMSSLLWVLEVLCCQYWQFLSNRSQQFMVDSCWSKLVNVVSGVSKGCVFGNVIVLPVHLRAFFHSGEYADRLCRWLHFDCCCA